MRQESGTFEELQILLCICITNHAIVTLIGDDDGACNAAIDEAERRYGESAVEVRSNSLDGQKLAFNFYRSFDGWLAYQRKRMAEADPIFADVIAHLRGINAGPLRAVMRHRHAEQRHLLVSGERLVRVAKYCAELAQRTPGLSFSVREVRSFGWWNPPHEKGEAPGIAMEPHAVLTVRSKTGLIDKETIESLAHTVVTQLCQDAVYCRALLSSPRRWEGIVYSAASVPADETARTDPEQNLLRTVPPPIEHASTAGVKIDCRQDELLFAVREHARPPGSVRQNFTELFLAPKGHQRAEDVLGGLTVEVASDETAVLFRSIDVKDIFLQHLRGILAICADRNGRDRIEADEEDDIQVEFMLPGSFGCAEHIGRFVEVSSLSNVWRSMESAVTQGVRATLQWSACHCVQPHIRIAVDAAVVRDDTVYAPARYECANGGDCERHVGGALLKQPICTAAAVPSDALNAWLEEAWHVDYLSSKPSEKGRVPEPTS